MNWLVGLNAKTLRSSDIRELPHSPEIALLFFIFQRKETRSSISHSQLHIQTNSSFIFFHDALLHSSAEQLSHFTRATTPSSSFASIGPARIVCEEVLSSQVFVEGSEKRTCKKIKATWKEKFLEENFILTMITSDEALVQSLFQHHGILLLISSLNDNMKVWIQSEKGIFPFLFDFVYQGFFFFDFRRSSP